MVAPAISDNAKLTRLLHCCKGEAARVIQACAVMEPGEGYKRALKMLKDRFGNEFMTAEAWVKKLTTGGTISPHNKQGLRVLADDLKGCQETLKALGHAAELNNQRVLISIEERLPNFLKNRWVREVQLIKRKYSRPPSVLDLVGYLGDVAEEANDPIYGRLTAKKKRGKTRVCKGQAKG